jgi:hypothetical protein
MPADESLAARQRHLLAALKGRTHGDGRFAAPQFALLRETLLWWRKYGIAQSCRFTTALLTAQGRFEDAVAAFVRDTPGADDIETQRELFLDCAQRDPDALCAAVAATEAALLARCGVHDEAPLEICWPQDPAPVFAALLRGQNPPAGPHEPYIVLVGAAGGLGWRRAQPKREPPPFVTLRASPSLSF